MIRGQNMFIHIGRDVVVPKKDIIAILDVRSAQAPITKEFIEIAKDEGFVENKRHDNKIKSYMTSFKPF